MTRGFVFCLIALAAGCMAQNAAAPQPAIPAAPRALRLGGVTITGSLRARAEAFNWFQAGEGDNRYVYSGNIFRISLAQQKQKWDWTAEFAVPFLMGLPANAVAAGAPGALGLGANYFTANDASRNTAMIFPKQLYVQLRTVDGQSLKLGRFEFVDGGETTPANATLATVKNTRVNQRLLGHFGWTNVGRSFDGFHYAYDRPLGNFTLVAAVPTRGVFQTDGWGWNRTVFGYASYTKPWGTGKHTAETRLLGLIYDDFRKVLKADNRPLPARLADSANIKIGTFGGHSLHAFTTASGAIDVLVWGAAQTGRWGIQNHRAAAFDAEAGFQPVILPRLKPWFRAGYYWGSGDPVPEDNRHETFFQVLPTPRPFARFPFFNMMNNRDVFGIATLRPNAGVTVANEFHALRVAERNDLWYLGGGVFQPWSFGYAGRPASGRHSLANLYDVNVEFRVNPNVTLLAYYGFAQGLAAVAAVYPNGTNGSFGYFEALYRF